VLQAEKFGAQRSVPAEVLALECSDGTYVLRMEDGAKVSGRTTRTRDRAGHRIHVL